MILLITDCALIKEKHNLQSSLDQLLTRHDNLTRLNDQCETRSDNLTEQRDQWKTSFDDLQTRLNNMTELKRIHCGQLKHHCFFINFDIVLFITNLST